MIYHVLPGDSLVEELKKTDIGGEVIVCREALAVGPVDAENLDEFWDQRARFILGEYGEDEIEYHDSVADGLAKLLDVDETDEVNLWFEYELFCSVNMWFCLSLLHETGAVVYRVEPSVLSESDRWKGFGKLNAPDLKRCFGVRHLFSDSDLKLGSNLWDAYRKNDHARLQELSDSNSTLFPYLKEVCEAAIEKETRPEEIVREIMSDGITEFGELFPEFSRRAGVYGFGDTQVQSLVDQLSS